MASRPIILLQIFCKIMMRNMKIKSLYTYK